MVYGHTHAHHHHYKNYPSSLSSSFRNCNMLTCFSSPVGPFQSDALLVPEHCIFDHYHDSRVCNEFDECNKTAMSKCALRQMTTQSFAMLWPCKEPGHFSGVEFVCCPKGL